MSVDSTHPLYKEFSEDWVLMRDAYLGERKVKERGFVYLPPTQGQVGDGLTDVNQVGYKNYVAYKTRAVYHEFVKMAVEAGIGIMHRKPPTIELPASMEPLRESCTKNKESLEFLLRRVNEQQLVTGRVGLLADLFKTPDITGKLPYIVSYKAEHILNWDDGTVDDEVDEVLNLVTLDESEYERREDFAWELVNKVRVLVLGAVKENEPTGTYSTAIVRTINKSSANISPELLVTPKFRGRPLEKIPFVFINSKDLLPEPDSPPLIGLGRLALAVYRGEADYRQALFMQGQDTLVVIGGMEEEDIKTGATSKLSLPQGGDAKYIGVSSQGLPEMRQAIENDKMMASLKAGQLVDTRSADKEGADTLRIRVAAQSATLNQMALAGAGGLQQILRDIAVWTGADPEKVVVNPNLDFAEGQLTGEDLVKLVTARTLGAPLSKKSIHSMMVDRCMTEMTYEEELEAIEEEDEEAMAKGMLGGTDAGGDPNDEEDEDEGPPGDGGNPGFPPGRRRP